jgi:hypothetical protein
MKSTHHSTSSEQQQQASRRRRRTARMQTSHPTGIPVRQALVESNGCRIRTSTGRVVDVRFKHYQIKQGVDVVLAPLKYLLLTLNDTNDYEDLTIDDACVSTTFEGADYVFASKYTIIQ